MQQFSEERLNPGPAPDWNSIFIARPDLDPPGYREVVEFLRSRQPDIELERLREKMKQIHKERVSARNKNRSARRLA